MAERPFRDRLMLWALIAALVVAVALFFVLVPKLSAVSRSQLSVVAAVHEGKMPSLFDEKLAALVRDAERKRTENRGAEAVSAYETIVKAYPDFADGYLRLGDIYYGLGIRGKAEEYYSEAIRRNLKNPEIYFHLGYIKEADGKFQEALEWYLKAEEKGVDNAELYFNLGNVFARMDNKAQAIDYYKKAVSVNPKHMDAYVNLSVMSFYLKDYVTADSYLHKAQELGYQAPSEYIKELADRIVDKAGVVHETSAGK